MVSWYRGIEWVYGCGRNVRVARRLEWVYGYYWRSARAIRRLMVMVAMMRRNRMGKVMVAVEMFERVAGW